MRARTCSLLLGLLLVGCASGRSPYRTADTSLELERVVLYRNGIGYFERHGEVEDDQLRIKVRRDQINDLLKSLTVIDRKSGKVRWQERIKSTTGRTSTWSSFVLSGDLLYLLTQASETVILKAGPKFEQVAANQLGDGLTNSSVVPSNGELFLRTHTHLWCISEKR